MAAWHVAVTQPIGADNGGDHTPVPCFHFDELGEGLHFPAAVLTGPSCTHTLGLREGNPPCASVRELLLPCIWLVVSVIGSRSKET